MVVPFRVLLAGPLPRQVRRPRRWGSESWTPCPGTPGLAFDQGFPQVTDGWGEKVRPCSPPRRDPACHTSVAAVAHLDSQAHLLMCIHQILGKHLPPCLDSLYVIISWEKKIFQKSSQCEKTKRSPFSPSLCVAVSRPSPCPWSPPPPRKSSSQTFPASPSSFLKTNFICLLVFGCAGSSLLCGLFSSYGDCSLLAVPSHCGVFSLQSVDSGVSGLQ